MVGISGLPPLAQPKGTASPSAEPRDDFGDLLLSSVEDARAAESHADDLGARFADGDPTVGIHEVMIATERAGVSLRYAVTLKNKAIEAYRELMNTPL